MNIWLVSMECAGLAEAGGVKNVTYSLCKTLSYLGNEVTLFIPVYACSSFDEVEDYNTKNWTSADVLIGHNLERVVFTTGRLKGTKVKIVFVNHPSFSEKQAVYVYTQDEEIQNPDHKRGNGHVDMLFLDALLSKAVAAYGSLIQKSEIPDIIHSQDASCAVIPSYIAQHRDVFFKTKTVVTIHNAGPAYHHEYSDLNQAKYYTSLPEEILFKAFNGNRIEPFLLAAMDGTLSTVSDYYAQELVSPSFNNETDGLSRIFYERGIKITGITNGIDYDRYNPLDTEVSLLPFAMSPIDGDLEGKVKNRNFMVELCTPDFQFTQKHLDYLNSVQGFGFLKNDDNAVYFMYHGRIVWQKGISILIPAVRKILATRPNAYFIIEGQGDINYENQLISLSKEFPGRIVYFLGYNRALSRLCAAASDFALFPSFFEPCGLEDLIAQIYGTIPLAHATGGLQKIIDGKTGFLYKDNTEEILVKNINRLIDMKMNENDVLVEIVKNAAKTVKEEFDWVQVVQKKYLKFFENI
ncbi:MAG: glycogen/starch synthase [Treponema sp.]|nr:glycogen/starch synthase [Treponema sp.]